MTPNETENNITIGLIDDDRGFLALMRNRIAKIGYKVVTGESGKDLFEILDREPLDTLILDVHLPDADGLDLLERIHQRVPDLPVIVETADSSGELGFKASARGAYDYVEKPVDFARLEILIRRATDHYQVVRRIHDLETSLSGRSGLCEIIGGDRQMQLMYSMIENVAASDATVLITGESGTGKELVACAVHRLSNRADREMVDLNCAAIPENLLESELFGHEKGAFTGATQRYTGCCERAHRSTLFLDEICEMNFALQSKLLRFIQERNFYRLGGRERIQVDTRILAATNKNPLDEVRANRFREDLYYRLNVVPIHVPPLRERRVDIRMLAEHFLRENAQDSDKGFRRFSEAAAQILEGYDWPGNVRELENAIAQVSVLHSGTVVEAKMLSPTILNAVGREGDEVIEPDPAPISTAESEDAIKPMWLVEKEAIERALHVTRGKVPDACAGLQMSRATLYRKVKKYEIELP